MEVLLEISFRFQCVVMTHPQLCKILNLNTIQIVELDKNSPIYSQEEISHIRLLRF